MKKYIYSLSIIIAALNGTNEQKSMEEQLVLAMRENNTPLARKIFTENKINLSYRFPKSRKSLLMEATTYGQEDIIKLLLQKGIALDGEFLQQAYNELEDPINPSNKKLKLLTTYYSNMTPDLLTHSIRHLRSEALKIFLSAFIAPTDQWEIIRKLYNDHQSEELFQEYYSLLRNVNPDSHTIPEEATKEEVLRYIRNNEIKIKLMGRMLKDYLGIYTERNGISKHGLKKVCNDGTGNEIVLPEIVLKNIARYRIQ